jgi:hypothetical protein
MDNSLLFRRKTNSGRLNNEQWYIGLLERGPRKCKIIPVTNRNAVTIRRIISVHVIPEH